LNSVNINELYIKIQ